MFRKIPSSPILREWFITFVIAHGLILCGCILSISTYLIKRLTQAGYERRVVESWLGSLVNLAGSVLVFFVAPLIQTFGRKVNLQIMFGVYATGWISLMLSPNLLCICVSLCIVSFGMVMTIPLTVTYISETCDKTRRGVLLSLDFVFVAIGNAVDYIFDEYLSWRVTAFILAIVACIGFTYTFIIPETKYWLLLKGDFKGAEASYAWFQPHVSAKKMMLDLATIQKTIDDDVNKASFFAFLRDIRKIKYLKGLLLGLVLYVLRVCAGRPIFVLFTENIFKNLRTPYNSETLAICYGIFDITGCVIVQYIVYKCNRKTLVLTLSVIMVSCLAMAVLYISFEGVLYHNSIPWFPVTCVYIYAMIVSTGYISTIGIMVSEIVYAEYRGPTMTFVTFGLFFSSYAITNIYVRFESVIPTEAVFIFFILSICLCVLVIFTFVPETARREFYETGSWKNPAEQTVTI